MPTTKQIDINAGLIPFEEACRLVNRHPWTVRKWLREGKLTRYKRGPETFIDPAELAPRPVAGPERRAAQK